MCNPWHVVTCYLPTAIMPLLVSLLLPKIYLSFPAPSLGLINASSPFKSQLKCHFHKESFLDPSDYIRLYGTHSTYFVGIKFFSWFHLTQFSHLRCYVILVSICCGMATFQDQDRWGGSYGSLKTNKNDPC